MDKVNQGVQTHLIQAVLGECESVFVLHWLSVNLTAPQFELIEQVAESTITKFINYKLLEPKHM